METSSDAVLESLPLLTPSDLPRIVNADSRNHMAAFLDAVGGSMSDEEADAFARAIEECCETIDE